MSDVSISVNLSAVINDEKLKDYIIFEVGDRFLNEKFVLKSISKSYNLFNQKTYWELIVLEVNGRMAFKGSEIEFLEWYESQKT